MYELISRFCRWNKITLSHESLLATICQYNPSSTCVSASSSQVGKEIYSARREQHPSPKKKNQHKSAKMLMLRSRRHLILLLSLISFLIATLQQFSIFPRSSLFSLFPTFSDFFSYQRRKFNFRWKNIYSTI